MTALLHSGSICLVAFVLVSTVNAGDDARDLVAGEIINDEIAKELSVPPLDHVEYPADRPAWLEAAPDFDSEIHTWVVVTGPCDTEDQCAEQLAVLQRAAVSAYIRQLTGSAQVDFYPVNDQWIESRLIVDSYNGKLTQGDTPMVEQAVKLEFSRSDQQKILAAWKNIEVRQRLGGLGVLVFLGLSVLVGSSSILSIISRRVDRKSQPAV
jgi:hypothetical protein